MSAENIESQLRLTNNELHSHLARLEKTLLEKESMVAAPQDSEKRYRRLFESARDGIFDKIRVPSGMFVAKHEWRMYRDKSDQRQNKEG